MLKLLRLSVSWNKMESRENLTLEHLQALARARGYEFSIERLTAVLPEVRRLQALAGRLRALPLDDLPPATSFAPR